MSPTARKCLVWDLDNTLWDGILLEGAVRLRPEVPDILATLDRRGILHSIASRGEPDVAHRQLAAFGLEQLFLAPRINWLPKPVNLTSIAEELGIGSDSLAFVDDDPFERESMTFMRPEVLVLDAARIGEFPELPAFNHAAITPESSRRREFYREESARRAAQVNHADRESFLADCRMRLVVRVPTAADVPRIRELMTRTHQLNTTGLLLEEQDIQTLLATDGAVATARRQLVVADFVDRFGTYGTIGVAITAADRHCWRLEYLAMSCRVLGRGVANAFLHALLRQARHSGFSHIEARLRETGRNGSMRTLYQMAGLRAEPSAPSGDLLNFTAKAELGRRSPSWVDVQCEFC